MGEGTLASRGGRHKDLSEQRRQEDHSTRVTEKTGRASRVGGIRKANEHTGLGPLWSNLIY